MPSQKPAADGSGAISPKNEASGADTSPDRLGSLAEQNTELARLVAANWACSPELLQVLSQHADPTVRKRVVSNPPVSAEVAANLGPQFPEQLVENPAFETLLLEEPGLHGTLGDAAVRSLVKRETCPVALLEHVAGLEEEATQLAALQHPTTPIAADERLKESPHESMRYAARWHVSVASEPPADWQTILDASSSASLKIEEPSPALMALAYSIALGFAEQRKFLW